MKQASQRWEESCACVVSKAWRSRTSRNAAICTSTSANVVKCGTTYVQLRNKLPKVRIKAEFDTAEFSAEVDAAVAAQIALYGNEGDYLNAQKQRNEERPALPKTPAQPGTLHWYWNGYKRSDHWLGDLSVGHEGLAESTRLQRTGLIESLLPDNREKPFAILTRKVIKAEMKARTPSQAGNVLSAVRGMIRWMIDERHLDEDDDPTIGLKSGKAKASRESGGFVPWTEDDMARYRAKWPLGTEARQTSSALRCSPASSCAARSSR